MLFSLDTYLEDIEQRLDDAVEQRVQDAWRQWMHHENQSAPFDAVHRPAQPSKLEWPHVNINDALQNDDLAVYRQFENVNRFLSNGSSAILRIRPDFGVGSIASAFGAQPYVMPYATDTLPTVQPLGEDAVKRLLNQPLPGPEAGNFAAINRIAQRYRAIKNRYPKIARYVHIEQPDLQSPMDNLELLWGSTFFYALYDEPETIHALLRLLSEAMEQSFDRWFACFPEEASVSSYFMHMDQGCICLRCDSAMNLSPEFYEEFVVPYDGRLLSKYGGIVHFCGRGDHYIEQLSSLKGLYGVNMSQPHLNDMEKIFSSTIDRGIHLSLSVAPFDAPGHRMENLTFIQTR